jgi:aflatoxin B1 aldehyde reductase
MSALQTDTYLSIHVPFNQIHPTHDTIHDLEMSKLNLIFNTNDIDEGRISHIWTTPEQTNELLKALEELRLREPDSAASYPPGSPWVTETLLDQSKAAEKGFVIDSKILAWPLARGRDPKAKSGAESLTVANIDASFKKSFELLGVDKLNIIYTHVSDPVTPAEESARAFDKHFRAGYFEKV